MLVAGELLGRSPHRSKTALASGLLKAGFNPDHIHADSQSSLDQVASAKNRELIDLLPAFGADINHTRNASGDSASWAAIRRDAFPCGGPSA